VQLARRLHRPSPPQARSGRRAARDPDGARRRLHPARAMSFRTRLTLLASFAVAISIAGTSVLVYYTYRGQLMSQVDGQLRSSLSIPAFKTIVTGSGAAGPGNFVFGEGTPKLLFNPKAAALMKVSVSGRTQAPAEILKAKTSIHTQTIAGVPSRVLDAKFA